MTTRKTIALTAAAAVKSLQSCLTLCDPIDSNPPGSSIHGISQARVLEWVDIAFSQRKLSTKELVLLLEKTLESLLDCKEDVTRQS